MDYRSAKAAGKDFPYTSKLVCYIEVSSEGVVSQVSEHDQALYQRLLEGTSRLFAVWPGNYRSDLFLIDDLTDYAKARGLVHDTERTGLQGHVHDLIWTTSSFQRGVSAAYVRIEIRFACGCSIKDIRVFAEQMKRQKGWTIGVSYGVSSSGGTYSVVVQRSTLQQ